MPRTLAIASLLLLSLSSVASAASSCVAFDIHWNLLAFNFGGKDYDAGTQNTWTQGQSWFPGKGFSVAEVASQALRPT